MTPEQFGWNKVNGDFYDRDKHFNDEQLYRDTYDNSWVYYYQTLDEQGDVKNNYERFASLEKALEYAD